MSATEKTQLLRAGVLDGTAILLACPTSRPTGGTCGAAVLEDCTGLGARVGGCGLLDGDGRSLDEAAVDAAVDGALAKLGSIDVLVVDGGALFAAAGPQTRQGLLVCLDASWNVTRAVVNRAFLAREASGRIVYLAPAPGDGAHAEAARAGLENLARTLSIEWSRYQVTTVTVAPGADTRPADVAAVVAYLSSPAGAYFSGCLLDLAGP